MNGGATRTALLVLLLFGSVSAFAGAVMAIVFKGAGVPLEYLQGSPFGSFLVPGIILGVVVGGTQVVAAGSLMAHRRASMRWAAIAGFGMIIWVFVELAIILEYSFLQTIYFGLGTLELVFVFLMLEIAPGTGRTSNRDLPPDTGGRGAQV
ncbi:hypothetical protein [Paeniglutamicibacter psychrophenolicus]|uniref:hypothetical protein n=1 Tax=Paeniglutamicibacter psychrophenolicus TaxID=257454 RepID=UPI0027838505|nr:hypothetical protein [Paeniglutamicibacter psychrophenolicus]MDQ0092375.1 hypothetical protein [Paeniglutamicibacter psychrophenolicus]